ncbi:MAG TPA: J domain-containing protein, partial [Ktedonobacterales bacterium]|nr:J domain-containing protein [Ktedonobacterales bacterium]
MTANDLEFDPYAILDLTPDATLADITRRYRKLMRTPRRGKQQPPPGAEEAAALALRRRDLKTAFGLLKELAHQRAATLAAIRAPAAAPQDEDASSPRIEDAASLVAQVV